MVGAEGVAVEQQAGVDTERAARAEGSADGGMAAGPQIGAEGADELDLYDASRFLSFAHAFNAIFVQARPLSEICSWDEDVDSVAGITRVEPHEADGAGPDESQANE